MARQIVTSVLAGIVVDVWIVQKYWRHENGQAERQTMSAIKCARCGRMTNTALCDWVASDTDEAERCYAAWDEEKECWVKGCAYSEESTDEYDRAAINFARKYIRDENDGQ